MCKFCDSFDSGAYGIRFDGDNGMIYSPAHVGDVPENERFQFCPVCGKSLLPVGVPAMDDYKVQMLETMLMHETSEHEVHYGAHLSHWYGDTKNLSIDAGGLQALLEYYRHHKTDMDGAPAV